MKVEIFCNKDELKDWLEVAKFSNFEENEKLENIFIDSEFEKEMMQSVDFTEKLPKNFQITFGPSILLCLKNEDGKIVGTSSIRRDEHKRSAIQVNNVAIHPNFRRNGYGKFLIEDTKRIAKEHSNARYLTLTTGGSHYFYEKIGMRLAGVLDFEDCKRYYFYSYIER